MIKNVAIIILIVAAFAGCTEQKEPLTLVRIPGHMEAYQFSYDIRDTVDIQSNFPEIISGMIREAEQVTFLINVTKDSTSPGYYSVTATNIVQKLKTYQVYQGKIVSFSVLVYDNQKGVWINGTEPSEGAVIWLQDNATKTSVDLENGAIYVRGDTSENMARAGDKLALIFMGISKETLSDA